MQIQIAYDQSDANSDVVEMFSVHIFWLLTNGRVCQKNALIIERYESISDQLQAAASQFWIVEHVVDLIRFCSEIISKSDSIWTYASSFANLSVELIANPKFTYAISASTNSGAASSNGNKLLPVAFRSKINHLKCPAKQFDVAHFKWNQNDSQNWMILHDIASQLTKSKNVSLCGQSKSSTIAWGVKNGLIECKDLTISFTFVASDNEKSSKRKLFNEENLKSLAFSAQQKKRKTRKIIMKTILINTLPVDGEQLMTDTLIDLKFWSKIPVIKPSNTEIFIAEESGNFGQTIKINVWIRF